MQKEFIIGEQLANGILQYLASRPYQEVFQLIGAFQQIKPIEAKVEEVDEGAKA